MATLEDFFIIDPDMRPRWRWAEFSNRVNDLGREAKRRIMDEALSPTVEGGRISTNEPIALKLMRPGAKGDILGTDNGAVVYTTRLVQALQRVRCTGLDRHPTVLYDRSDNDIIDSELWWIRVKVGADLPDETRGFPLYFTDYWRSDINMTGAVGMYFDPESWTGLDVFRFPRSGTVLITRRVAEVIRAGGFDGIQLESALDYGKALRDQKVAWLHQRYPDGLPPDVAR